MSGQVRLLWYSLGPWFVPSAANSDVFELSLTMSDEAIAAATSSPYTYFFEPTPYPQVNNYDPIHMAVRLARVGKLRPTRAVAFASHPSPTPFETQCAFAAQAGHLLDVPPEIHRVTVATRGWPRDVGAKKEVEPDSQPRQVDPGPSLDWRRALDEAVRGGTPNEGISATTEKLVKLYLFSQRGEDRFSPIQKSLLYRASIGDISVVAEEIADALPTGHKYAERAVRGIAAALFGETERRRSNELVGRLVVQYAWFLQYNGS